MQQEFEQQDKEILEERRRLALERLAAIPGEARAAVPFREYFQRTAAFLLAIHDLAEKLKTGEMDQYTIQQLKAQNTALYEDIIGGNYERSYANPAYACKMLGRDMGQLLGMLCAELRSMIPCAYEGREEELLIFTELFLQIYGCFSAGELRDGPETSGEAQGECAGKQAFTEEAAPAIPAVKEIREILYWFFSDYSDLFMTRRVADQVDERRAFAVDIICGADLSDLKYLYRFGEYVTDNELETAAFLNELPQEEIDRMAHTMSEGYRKGFENGGKDLSKKKTVNIRYHLGFERVIRQVIVDFAAMGLKPVIYRKGTGSLYGRAGYEGADPNPQYAYDHRADNAVYLDKRYVERRLGAQKNAYEAYRERARVHAGPACLEVFGETPFAPETKEEALSLTDRQQKLSVELANASSRMTNRYIPGDERSFTIIAYPLPQIGERYREIFREIVKINTLDYEKYQRIQQVLIDALDAGASVHIQGKGDNVTDLTVALHPLTDPKTQTNFENCVADVNIPVGEVFTSPRLAGTNGTLFVSGVYLDSLYYKDLKITFRDGMVADYDCGNFDSREENQRYIRENVLHYHDTLPMGEFAIGTNTTAYVMAEKYRIADRLPILIAEKMGPHFAVGDTCYSHEEDRPVYNPDRKEIIARDNECSLLRKTDPGKAYFNTHVDITIPYDELGRITVTGRDGSSRDLIVDGRFVLPGTEALNEPFENM